MPRAKNRFGKVQQSARASSFSAASCCVGLGELLNLSDPPGEAGAEYSGVVLVSGKIDRYLGVAAISQRLRGRG